MSLTYGEAVDEITTIFKTAWDTTGHKAFYESVKLSRNSNSDPWAVVTLRHAAGFQATLANNEGARTYRRQGDLTIQIFIKIGKGLQEFYNLAKVVSDAYEGSTSPGGVWFRNIRINEVGRDGEFHHNNVKLDFEYDEIK